MYLAHIYTINIHVNSTHIHSQNTCIKHPYTQSTYMYLAPIYTINIDLYSSHMDNQHTYA